MKEIKGFPRDHNGGGQAVPLAGMFTDPSLPPESHSSFHFFEPYGLLPGRLPRLLPARHVPQDTILSIASKRDSSSQQACTLTHELQR